MKKTMMLIGLFVTISLSGYSRNALPFQGSKWTYIYSREFSHNFIYFYVQGDTVIDNISRSKLYVISDNAPNESHLLGFLHSTDKKVYLRTYENSWRGDGFYGLAIDPDTDYLMYDFSLEKGDEFTKPITLGYTEKMYIYDVDSIEIGNTKKKRYTIKDSPDSQSISDYWIEGMGSVEYGIILYGFEAIPTCFCSKSFICYSENGETLYLNPEFDECPLLAQQNSYRSYFGEEFSKWYVGYEHYDTGFSVEIKTDKQDTVLTNGQTYYAARNVYSRSNEEDFYCYGLREDREEGTLYINLDGEEEIPVSKMNLFPGDKFYFSEKADVIFFSNIREDENGYYTLVSNVYIEGNRKHVRLEAICNPSFHVITPYPLIFIEGIGPNCSFDPFIGYAGILVSLICYETETEYLKILKYWDYHPDIDDCLFSSAGIPEIEKKSLFSVFQQGEKLIVTFDSVIPESGEIKLYSIAGKLYARKEINGNKTVEIPVSGIPSGAYIVHLTDSKQKIKGKKVMIIN